jgi:hypothetical protein
LQHHYLTNYPTDLWETYFWKLTIQKLYKSPLFSIIPSLVLFFCQKYKVKNWHYCLYRKSQDIKYVSFPWHPVVAAHDRNRLARAPHNRGSYWLYKNYPYTQDSAVSIRPYHSLQTSQYDKFPIQIAVTMTMCKAQGQTLIPAAIYPPSPVFPPRLAFRGILPIFLTWQCHCCRRVSTAYRKWQVGNNRHCTTPRPTTRQTSSSFWPNEKCLCSTILRIHQI